MSADLEWIDDIVAMMGTINAGAGSVTSYKIGEWPGQISTFPASISYVSNGGWEYSLGGPTLGFYEGFTELHLAAGKDSRVWDTARLYVPRVFAAFCADFTLGGKVEHFLLKPPPEAFRMTFFNYGDGESSGLTFSWRVKVNETGLYTIG
jgi:hypothetical protein